MSELREIQLDLGLAHSWDTFSEPRLSLCLSRVWRESGINWRTMPIWRRWTCKHHIRIMATVCWQLPHLQQLSSGSKRKFNMSNNGSDCETHLIALYFLLGVVTHSLCLFLLTCYWSKSFLMFYLFNLFYFLLQSSKLYFLFNFNCSTRSKPESCHSTMWT